MNKPAQVMTNVPVVQGCTFPGSAWAARYIIIIIIIIVIILIITIIIIISFMQGIYTYIPETKYFPGEYSVVAILFLLFMVLISLVPMLNLLYFYISTFRSRAG
jgi:hypothetical protein